MKKVININFQGRVIPIEESAYETLKNYTESLRRYFAQEEGKDEIINDIENRIAELFAEKLQKGATCITDEDLEGIMDSMGRPEDLEQQEASMNQQAGFSSSSSYGESRAQAAPEEPRRLYRSENDKVLGGVCAGLAHYLRIDPAVVRLLFAVITFGGFGTGILIYIIMWIILPKKDMASNIRKRLYRNPDNKIIGGVASGLAAYFHIDTWIPRLIFLLPLILGTIPNIMSGFWFDWDGPKVIFGGFGGTLFITYIILWIVLPEATTASEKLEMRGEKVDLESIKNTIQEDLQSFKGKAQAFGEEVKSRGQAFAAEAAPVAKKTGTGLGNAIGILFKAFFLFIAGVIAFALLMALMGILFSGVAVFPLKNFLLDGFWQNTFAYGTLILFLGVPLVGLATWLIRRIIGMRSQNNYLGYVFGGLWLIGLFCMFGLIGSLVRDFRMRASVKEEVSITQPATNGLQVKVEERRVKYYDEDFFDGDFPFLNVTEDSMLLNTARVRLVKSPDSNYHVFTVRYSKGNNPVEAEKNANGIIFPVQSQDSVLLLPAGFPISRETKFRNQQVLLVIEVPKGKRIRVDRSVSDYEWFNVETGRRRGWNVSWNSDWDDAYNFEYDVEYIMSESGLVRMDEKEKGAEGSFKVEIDEKGVKVEGDVKDQSQDRYRYDDNRNVDPEERERIRRELRTQDSLLREKSDKEKTIRSNTRNERPVIDTDVSEAGLKTARSKGGIDAPFFPLTYLFALIGQ